MFESVAQVSCGKRDGAALIGNTTSDQILLVELLVVPRAARGPLSLL